MVIINYKETIIFFLDETIDIDHYFTNDFEFRI